ncbi:MAG: tetratricopeptide repeat protein, partial [Planctomycetes bacterium]|nr:tetratricopeptide repeat protein [Planctomycetota bacterium]
MKANILTVLGVGLPLAIMMMLWRWLDAAPRDSRAAAASRPATTLGPSDREALRGHPALRQFSTVSSPAARQPSSPAMALLDTLDEYAAQWEEAARSDPAYPRVAALALLRRGRYEAAVQAFDRLLVREPDDVGLATGKAMALAGLGRYDDALPLFEHVARTDARDLAAQFNYAVALMRSAEREAAIGTFRGVLELDPGHAKARFNLALLLQAVGRSGEALD